MHDPDDLENDGVTTLEEQNDPPLASVTEQFSSAVVDILEPGGSESPREASA
jgi:hypothetical protein